MRHAIIFAAALSLSACTVGGETASDAILAMGFKDVKLGGPSLFGCSDKDTFTRTFTATGVNGQRMKGVVCSGFLKGATVRITGRA